MRPEVGASSPVSILIVVDFPAPFGPRNPKKWPACTFRSMASTAVSAPNVLVSFSVAIAISPMISTCSGTPAHATLSPSDTQLIAGIVNASQEEVLCLAAGNRRRAWHLGPASRQSRQDCRKFHAKHGAARLPVVAEYFPAMLLQDAVADA